MGPSTFDTCVGFVAVSPGMPVLLASDTLWDVFLICPWRFCGDNFVLDGRYIIDIFVVIGWLQVYKE